MSGNNRKNIDVGVNVSLVAKISLYILIIIGLFFIQIASSNIDIDSQDKIAAIEGKGIWIINTLDGKNLFMNNIDDKIKSLKNEGITYIIFPVFRHDISFQSFAQNDLNILLPAAHKNGMKVLGWGYLYIDNSDSRDIYIQKTSDALKFETNGEKLDGFVADIEQDEEAKANLHLTENDVKDYVSRVRTNVGKDFLFAAATDCYLSANTNLYNWFNKYFDVLLPMIYWNHKVWETISQNNNHFVYDYVNTYIFKSMAWQGSNPKPIVDTTQLVVSNQQNEYYIPNIDEIIQNLKATKKNNVIGISFWYLLTNEFPIMNPNSDQSIIIRLFNWPTSINIYNNETSARPPKQENLHRDSLPFKGGGTRISNNKETFEKYVDGQYHINGIPIRSYANDHIRLTGDEYVQYSLEDNVNGDGYSGKYVYLLLNAVNGLNEIKNHKIGEVTVTYTDGSSTDTSLILGQNIRNNYDGNLAWNYYGKEPIYVTELKDTNAGWAWRSMDRSWWIGMLRIEVDSNKKISKIRVASVYHSRVIDYGVYPAIQLMGISVVGEEFPPMVLRQTTKTLMSNTAERNIFESLYYMVIGQTIQRASTLTAFDYSPFQSAMALELTKVFLKLSVDPLDANYAEMVQPSHYKVPKLNYSDDLPNDLTDQLNSELMSEVETYAYLEALYTSINRYTTALEVKDYNSVQMQLTAIKNFTRSAYFSMDESATELRAINKEWQELNLTNPVFDLKDITDIKNNISESGFPPEVIEALAVFNATPEEIQNMRNQISYLNTESATLDYISLMSLKENSYYNMSRDLIDFSNNITVHPYITDKFPQNLNSNVSIKTNLTASFSERMNPGTINDLTFILIDSNGLPINGTIELYSPVDEKAILRPDFDLKYNTTYKATLTTGIESVNGTNMYSNFSWWFTTEAEPDMTPPLTTISQNPPIPDGKNNWYISNVQINITANDSQSGINRIEYSFDNTSWYNYTSSFIIDQEGTTIIYARSLDNAGNIEIPVKTEFKLDKTYPVTIAVFNGSISNGTFTKNVTLILTAKDNLSGIAAINYSMDGIIWKQYSEQITINKEGLSKIYYRSEDNANNIEETKSIDVIISNPLPVFQKISDIIVNENDLIYLTPTASDPENDTLTFNFSQPLNSSGMWQTTYDDAGEYTATVTISDGFSNVSQDVKITVLNVNRPPVLAPIGTLNAMAGSYFSYNVIASDPDNDQLTYSDDSPVFDINPFTGEIGFVPKGNQSFNITVSDGMASVSEKGFLEIRSTNRPPEIEFIFPKIALAGGSFNLAVNASDPDGDNLTFADDTELFDINATTGRIEFSPGSGQIGTYFISITVTDGIETDEAVLNLVVRPDRPLRLEPVQDIVAYVGDLVRIVANATYG